MPRKSLSKPPLFAQIMQEEFGKATRLAAARAEMAGVKLAGARRGKDNAPLSLTKASRGRKKA
jgi:hypothetical protein